MADEVQEQFDHDFDSVDFTDSKELVETIAGVKPRLEQEFDLTKVDPGDRVQVRIDKNNAPKEMVERFAIQMAFSSFRPIVVTEDARIIDGNTRYRARKQREERYTPALVVPISWDEADDATRLRLIYLGEALNNSNGKPLEKEERREMVRNALRIGMSGRQVSVTTGFAENVVRGVRRELDAQEKLERVGIEPKGVRDASLRALGKASDLNDEPFAEVAQLTVEAGFAANEINALVASVRDVGSDELALERISRERDANAQRISDRAAGSNGQPPAARQLKQRLGYINNREPQVFVETNRERMQEHLDAIREAQEKLAEIERLQVEVQGQVVA